MMYKTISTPRIENIRKEAPPFQQAMSLRFTNNHESYSLRGPQGRYIIEVNKETKENRHAYVRQGVIPKDTIITTFPRTPNQNKTIFHPPGLQYASDSTDRLFFKNGDRFTFQVGTSDDSYPHMDHELVVFMNHDCNANCKFEFDGNTISIVSCQEIQTGAPLTFDYRTTEKTIFSQFPCGCASCKEADNTSTLKGFGEQSSAELNSLRRKYYPLGTGVPPQFPT